MVIGTIRRRYILYKMIISYFLIFVTPLIIMAAILYKTAVIDLQKEIESSNLYKLTQLKDTLDTRIKELETIALKINIDIRLSPIKMSSNVSSKFEGIDKLNTYKVNNNFIDELYIYYKEMDSIFSPSGQFSPNVLVKNLYNFSNKDDEKNFIKYLNTIDKPTIKVFNKTEYTMNPDVEFITYLFPVSFSNKKPNMVVIFAIRTRIMNI